MDDTHGRVAIDSEESEICSRCRSTRDIVKMDSLRGLFFNCWKIQDVYFVAWIRGVDSRCARLDLAQPMTASQQFS